jgi:transcriptional regulator with XRE-family HTH domain
MNITKILKERRQELGISQAKLARQIGLKHKSSIHHLEAGRNKWWFESVVKACELLDLEITISKIQFDKSND